MIGHGLAGAMHPQGYIAEGSLDNYSGFILILMITYQPVTNTRIAKYQYGEEGSLGWKINDRGCRYLHMGRGFGT